MLLDSNQRYRYYRHVLVDGRKTTFNQYYRLAVSYLLDPVYLQALRSSSKVVDRCVLALLLVQDRDTRRNTLEVLKPPPHKISYKYLSLVKSLVELDKKKTPIQWKQAYTTLVELHYFDPHYRVLIRELCEYVDQLQAARKATSVRASK